MQNVSLEWTLLRPDTTKQWTRARRLLQGQRYVKSVRHSLVQGHTQITRSSGERCISEAVLHIRHKSILTILPWLPI